MAQNNTINVGSRKSQLALIQTNNVIEKLRKFFPHTDFRLVSMSTTGDKILDTPLSKIGEKSLFTKELEHELEAKNVDMIVHSLKDLPTVLPDGMCIGAVCSRDDPYDGVVMRKDLSYKSLSELPDNSVIGTSSLRRIAQLKRQYPNLQFKDIRGNLNTRLSKLDDHQDYSAIILAVAGLERMKWGERLTERLCGPQSLYAVSQGAVAVECRRDDDRILAVLSKITDPTTVMSVVAERAYLATLEGGCSVPIGVRSLVENNQISLSGGVYNGDGSEAILDNVTTELSTTLEAIGDDTKLPEVEEQIDGPPQKRMRRTSTTDSVHYNEDSSIGVEFSGIYAYVHAGCLYGNVLRQCQITGEQLAKQMLENGADKILEVTKKACAEEIEKRRLQLLKKRASYGLKEGDIPASHSVPVPQTTS